MGGGEEENHLESPRSKGLFSKVKDQEGKEYSNDLIINKKKEIEDINND